MTMAGDKLHAVVFVLGHSGLIRIVMASPRGYVLVYLNRRLRIILTPDPALILRAGLESLA